MRTLVEIVIGLFLAIGFILLVRRNRSYAREKRSFAISLVVVALIYLDFGLFSGSVSWVAGYIAVRQKTFLQRPSMVGGGY